MRFLLLNFLVLCLGCFGIAPALAGEAKDELRLSGTNWWIHEDADGQGVEHGMPKAHVMAPGWIPATVPGNIQADLEAAHRLKPLWYGLGDARLHEVAERDWWYRTDVAVPATFAGQRATLVFDGVDHECEIFLNGQRIGTNAGMYKRFWFDVSQALQPGQVNRLAVRIARMPEELRTAVREAEAPGGPNVGHAVSAVLKRLKELKSPTNHAWDWAVAVYTLGIWKDVRLETSGPARIEWVRVQTPLGDNYRRATVKTTLEVDSAAPMRAQAVFCVRRLNESLICARAVVNAGLKKGRNEIHTELAVANPDLWWPNGQGGQPLYELESTLALAGNIDGSPAIVSDQRATRFGMREIRWEQTPGTPADFINPLKLVVNGRPVRQMGSNLLPPDSLFGRLNARGPRLLELAHAAGINCLRLWGGGVILSEIMYDRADELGIMLLQEFPLANNLPETNEVMLSNLQTTAINIVRQVRNHPSLVEWSGGNEMPWKNGDQHPALQFLERVVRHEDGRIFRATEPAQGSGSHGSYTYVYHTEPAPWLSWLGAGNRNLYQRYDTSVEMRISEFGTHSPANWEVWQRTIPPASQWPLTNYDDPVLIRKNVFWGAVFKENWLHKEITERLFGPLAGLEQLIPAGQFLGAEGLRYAMDALRRKGPALGGGFMSWNYNEPWPNGAGSYMVDYDGRPLMNYYFAQQALAPLSLSLKYPSLLYDPAQGIPAQLFLASDAPATARQLRWHWKARDRRGTVFAQGQGVVDSIEPQGVRRLETLTLRPPPETALGPVFVELGLSDARGGPLVERLHLFGAASVQGPFSGLLRSGLPDLNDTQDTAVRAPDPRSPLNLAWVGNGAAPAAATAELPGFEMHRAKGLNDGRYGNSNSWIGGVAGAALTIEMAKVYSIGRFRLGRDRTGAFADRGLDSLKLEISVDGTRWQPIFERQGLSSLPGCRPAETMQVEVAPVQAKWVRATVNPAAVCLDEFEVYAPAAHAEGGFPQITFGGGLAPRPVTRTTLEAKARPAHLEGDQEILELVAMNRGSMTALFCEPHSLIEYRTDLFIEGNHCFIPPGESRTITIRAPRQPKGGLSLAQTGWRIGAWNVDERVIEPGPGVLLALGRRDAMCREFAGCSNPGAATGAALTHAKGPRPDPAQVWYLADGKGVLCFEFTVSQAQAERPARLRIHTADQSEKTPAKVVVTINGQPMAGSLPLGLGIQRIDPAHLAFPATLEFSIPAKDLRPGKNILEVRVKGEGWWSWDALDLVSSSQGDAQVPRSR